MHELVQLIFSLVNAPLTVFLIGMLFYWLLVILGALDIHIFDTHIEIDKHFHVDKHINTPNKDIDLKDLANAEMNKNIRNRNRKLNLFKTILVYFKHTFSK